MTNQPDQGGRAEAREANSEGGSVPAQQGRRRVRRRSLVLVAVAAVALLGVVWWVSRSQSGGGSNSTRMRARAMFGPNAAIPVVAQKVKKGDIDIYMDGLGTVTPLATVIVRTRISGQLTEVHFKEGQRVQAGDLLAVIDPRPYQVALEQAEGQLLQAKAQLEQARSDYARYETLSRQDSIAVQQVDTQRALVSQDEALVKTDQAAIDNARLNLIYCHITAPITGRVGLRQVDPGNYVTPGDANGIVTLTQMRPISVIFTLPEDSYSQVGERLHAGAKLPVTAFDSTQTHELATGVLTAIDNQADTSTGTFKLRASFPNEKEGLFPNQFVNVRMLLKVERNVMVIQSSAVELGQMGTYVYVVQPDNTVKAHPVTLGPTQGEKVAVLKGLAVGDRVVVDGADRLREGGRVIVQQPGQQSGAAVGGRPGDVATHGWQQRGHGKWNGKKSWRQNRRGGSS